MPAGVQLDTCSDRAVVAPAAAIVVSAGPRLVAIDAACCALSAFAKAAPEAQPDAA